MIMAKTFFEFLANSLFFLLIFPSFVLLETFEVPVMVGQTGASSTFGKGELNAYQLAVEEWNEKGGIDGKKIELLVEDTQTKQVQILNAYHRLAAKNPPVILGPTWLDGFQAVVAPARKQNVLLVTPSAARESLGEENLTWAITLYHNSTRESEVLVEDLKERGFENTAVIFEQEPFAEMFVKLVQEASSGAAETYGVQGGETDFHALLNRMKSQSPDALILLVWNEQSLLSLLQQLKIHLPDIQLATIHDGEGWLSKDIFRPYLDGLLYAKFVVAEKDFSEKFEKRFAYKPMLTATNAYDAMNIVLKALSDGATSAQEIRSYIFDNEHDTVTFGKVRFSEEDNVPSLIEIIQAD